ARPRGGDYLFDVTQAAQSGSAGAVSLIFQAVCWPLLFADAPSRVVLRGGTHVPFSPPFHYLSQVALPAFARLGADIELALTDWGWYPAGGGEMTATIRPVARLEAADFVPPDVTQVQGLAVVTNLPAHIPNRMAQRAYNLLRARGLRAQIEALRARGPAPGAGLVLWVPQGGFTSLGRKGLPADQVAETAVAQLLAFIDNNAAVDPYLADQLLLPLALARGTATYTTHTLTRHTVTNAALLRHWLDVSITVQGEPGGPATLTITGCDYQPA
ncbi:MAG: RNA 3'-terminal phosphate cyclase, partial [Anaerolineales bacterium]|nr:RNA 3'-terminal phosphate cyclase [Anaerolineales bacterium]